MMPSDMSLRIAEQETSPRNQAPFVSNPDISKWDDPSDRLPLIDGADGNVRQGHAATALTSPKSLATLGLKNQHMSPAASGVNKNLDSNLPTHK